MTIWSLFIDLGVKNLGLGVLFALLGGPFGLLYASILGGIVMLFIAIFSYLFAFLYLRDDLLQGNVYAILDIAAYSFIYPLLFIIYYAVCIIWAIVAINDHNNQLNRQTSINLSPQFGVIDSPVNKWLGDNPGKSINDYYVSLKHKSNIQ